jgi:hypothetical protein
MSSPAILTRAQLEPLQPMRIEGLFAARLLAT